MGVLALNRHNNLAGLNPLIIIIIITLLSLNIYKHVCDKYKQTNNCVYEKEKKKRTNIIIIYVTIRLLSSVLMTVSNRSQQL